MNNQKIKSGLLLFLMAIALFTCGKNDTVVPPKEDDVFFSLVRFIKAEVNRLNALEVKLKKRITINDKNEEKLLSDVPFAEELSLFRSADINRPRWSDAYQVDSIFSNKKLSTLTYTALDTTLKTRLLTIHYGDKKEDINKVEITRRSASVLADNTYQLVYVPQHGYQIETQQNNKMGEDMHIIIDASFVE